MYNLVRILVIAAALFAALPLWGETNHTIRPGETLYSLARRYDSSAEAIIAANEIPDHTNIAVGTTLVIPVVVPQSHRVRGGETYYSVAKRYGMSVSELLALNDRDSATLLKVGETLLVPVERVSTGSAVKIEPEPASRARSQQTVSTRVAPTVSNNLWPHSGERGTIAGKFPAVTFDAQAGDAVRAVHSGRVVYISNRPNFGRVVFVRAPGGEMYIYGGNDTLEVQVGSVVSVGSIIGRVGRPGAHGTSPRVYFSVWHNNSFLNPHEVPRG